MPSYSRFSVAIPQIGLSTFLFGSPNKPLPDRLAYADTKDPDVLRLTFEDCRSWAKRFAAGLLAAGLQKGDRVLMFASNNIFHPTVYLGTVMAGGIYNPANAKFVPRELAFQLKDSGAKFVLASEENIGVALEAAKIVGMDPSQIFLFDHTLLSEPNGRVQQDRNEVRHWRRLIASVDAGEKFVWSELSPEEVMTTTALLAYSSGTTGLPKGMEISHYNLVANAVQTGYMMDLDPKLSQELRQGATDRWLCAIPIYHGLASTYFTIIAIWRRTTWYCMRQFEINHFLDAIERYRITELHVVPPIMLAMTKSAAIKSGKVDLSCVRATFSSAAPLGAEVTRQFEQMWPDGSMNVKQGFAMGEASCNMLGWDPRRTAPPGSVGEIMPNGAVKLMMDDGVTEASPGDSGEVWFRGPNVMKGYWKNAAATREVMTPDGWLKTGDVARVDSEGCFYIVDRKKELIKVKGVQIAPAEIEAILLDHPEILDAAVVGRKVGDDELPQGFIVRAKSSSLTSDKVIAHLRGKVSKNKLLGGGVVFIEAIPRNPSGKILRRELRDRATKNAKSLGARL